MSQMTVCRFKIRKAVDPDEFEKSIAAAVTLQKKAGATRSGQLSGYRLLRGNTTGNERAYVLELEGLMSLPAGIGDAVKSASAGRSPQTPTSRRAGGSADCHTAPVSCRRLTVSRMRLGLALAAGVALALGVLGPASARTHAPAGTAARSSSA